MRNCRIPKPTSGSRRGRDRGFAQASGRPECPISADPSAFAGLFRADVSTVNNEACISILRTFVAEDQDCGSNELFLICSYCRASINAAVRVPGPPFDGKPN